LADNCPPDVQKLAQGKVTDALQSTAEDPYQLAPAFLMLKGVLDTPTGTDVVDEKSGDVKPGTIGDTKIVVRLIKLFPKRQLQLLKRANMLVVKLVILLRRLLNWNISSDRTFSQNYYYNFR